MADKSITGLTAASTLDGTELAVVTQGGNSRKVTATKVISEVSHSATGKTTPVDNDELPLVDSAASNVLKKLLWSNVKATLKTYFDTLYAATGGAFTAASTTEVLTGTDAAKGVTPDALAALWEKGADVASSGTVSLGEGGYFHITGTTGITDIDWATAKDGRPAWVIFDGILTLTHNATTLKLPGAANITTAAGDRALFIQDASDNVICLAYIRADGSPLAGAVSTGRQIISGGGLTGGGDLSADRTLVVGAGTGITVNADDVQIATAYQAIGKHTIYSPALSMASRTTNGAAAGTAEMTTNKNMVMTLDFDTTTQEFAQFDVAMPKGWDNGTVTFIAYWSHAATTTNFGVAWGLDAVAISDDDTLDVAFGTAGVVTDTGGTTNDLYVSSESSAITIAGTPATGDLVQFRIHRDPANGSDTMAIDARLHGIKLLFTLSAANDA
jgi:hypothetical protein